MFSSLVAVFFFFLYIYIFCPVRYLIGVFSGSSIVITLLMKRKMVHLLFFVIWVANCLLTVYYGLFTLPFGFLDL